MSSVADIVELEQERSRRAPITDSEFANAGAMLKAAREASGYSIDQVHDATNVRPDYLEAIESMDIEALPIAAYTSGFVKAYAQHLELPADAMVARFRMEAGYEAVATVPELPAPPKTDLTGGRELSLLAVVSILFFVIWVAFQITRPSEQIAGPVEIEGTPLQQRPIDTPEITYTEQNVIPAAENEAETSVAVTEPAIAEIVETAGSDVSAPVQQGPLAVETLEEETVSLVTAIDDEPASEAEALILEPDFETSALEDILVETEELATSDESTVLTELVEEALNEDIGTEETPLETAITETQEVIITDPVRLRVVSPIYPRRCQRRAEDVERVVVTFDVTADGLPVNQRVTSTTNTCFNSPSLNALDRWTFEPATRDGKAIPSYGQSTDFVFRLPE